jgi:O-antigen/teichoic acid export membrane protein
MGIIIRQGVKTSAINFGGAAIGMLSVLFVYPLAEEAVGFVQFLYSAAVLLAPLIGMGMATTSVKYFHEFKDQKTGDAPGFFYFLLTGLVFGGTMTLALLLLGGNKLYTLLEKAGMNQDVFRDNQWVIFTLAIFVSTIILTNSYISNFGKTSFPSLVSNFGYKVFLPILILAYYYGLIVSKTLSTSIILFHMAATVVLMCYLRKSGGMIFGKLWHYFQKETLKDIVQYSLYNTLTNLSSLLAYRLDIIMVTAFLDFESAGTYFLIVTMASVIEIPTMAISNISGPVISKSLKNNELHEVEKVYQLSGINLLIGGIALSFIIWFCFYDLASISSKPDVFKDGRIIFGIMALTKLTDMATGMNNHIINYSAYFRYNLYFVLVLGVFNIIANIILIPKFGIIGAALATLLSMSIFNIAKGSLVFWKFRMLPFHSRWISLLSIAISSFLLITLAEKHLHYFFVINIALKVSLIALLFIFPIYLLQVSLEFNKLLKDMISKLLKK